MDALQTILSRQSVREYTGDAIPESTVEALLRAAMNAPSAGNEQPWHFLVIRDRETLEEIARIHTYAQMLRSAPLALLICGDLRLSRFPGTWVQDCAAATQNVLLAAQSFGLGGVWVGVHPVSEREAAFRRLLGIPAEVVPFSLVPIGHPAAWEPREDRFDAARIHRERW